jgi:hypothetical protein
MFYIKIILFILLFSEDWLIPILRLGKSCCSKQLLNHLTNIADQNPGSGMG